MSTPTKARSWMDEFLSTRDFSAIHEIRINAPPTVVYRCLLRCNFNDLWLVRLLMTIRTGKRPPRSRIPAIYLSGSKARAL